jgi:hypothetical protein
MLLPQHGILGRGVGEYFVAVVAGDSNAAGRAAAPGPTTAAGTAYEYDDGTNSLTELTTNDLSTTAGTFGSFAKQFAIDHHARTGQKVVFVACGIPSSTFYPLANTNNWFDFPSGVNYGNMQTKVTSCLALLGRAKPDVFLWSLGCNDENQGVTTGNFQAGVSSLLSRLDADYPGVKKLWVQIGRWVASANSLTGYAKRNILINSIELRADHAMCANALTYVFTTGYEADAIHYNNASQNALGKSFAKYLGLASIPNKWARGIVASWFTTPTAPVQTAIVDLVTTLYANSNYFTSEGLFVYVADDVYNISIDFCFMQSAQIIGGTFSAGNYIRNDGVNDYIASSLVPSFYLRAGQNDVIYMVKVLTNRTGGGTAAFLFGGVGSTTPFVGLQTSGVNAIIYRINDTTTSNTALRTTFGNNHFYAAARNGTSKLFIEDLTTVISATISSTGVSNATIPNAVVNGNGILSNYLDCDLESYYVGAYTTLSLTDIQTKIQALIDAY